MAEVAGGVLVDTHEHGSYDFAAATGWNIGDGGQLSIFDGARVIAVFAHGCWIHVRAKDS